MFTFKNFTAFLYNMITLINIKINIIMSHFILMFFGGPFSQLLSIFLDQVKIQNIKDIKAYEIFEI